MFTLKVCLLLLICGGLVPVQTFAQQSTSAGNEALQNLAARIAEQRARLEALSDQLNRAKSESDATLGSLATQTADVEALLNRERIQLRQIEEAIDRAEADIERAESGSVNLSPLVDNVIERLRTHFERGIPFQQSQRLNTLASIERLRQEGSLGDQTALTRLWNLVDSEFRLVADSGIYRQTIELEGESKLVEVVRLGMVLMYFRTLDGEYGFARPVNNGQYEFIRIVDRDSQLQVEELFDALSRNLRRGFFNVPNPLSEL